MPEAVGAVGAAGAGLAAIEPIFTYAAEPALKYIASEWGAPAIKAIEEAGARHPIVAKLLAHALADAGALSVAKYMKLFGNSGGHGR